MSKRKTMPGLRLRGEIWHIEKRCKYAEGGWLRESTGKTSLTEAEEYLIRRLAGLQDKADRQHEAIYLFEEAALRYLEEKAHQSSAINIATHIDHLLPFIGQLPLEQVHDGTLRPYIEHEIKRGLAPKSINNGIVYVSAILNRAARVWRHEDGRPWLRQAPPRLTRQSTKGRQAKPYPLSWSEQDKLFAILPRHLAEAALFKVNTGCREQEVCKLKWDWEIRIDALGSSVFVLPEYITKTDTERVIVLNSIASSVIDARRGLHPEYVFTYKGKPVNNLRTSAWRRAWIKAGLPMDEGILKGVHNLRHTFGRRLRAAGIVNETRKALLGHAHGDITTHYSAAELEELLNAAERVTDRTIAQTPTLSVVSRKGILGADDKLSAKKKRVSSY